jgi:hypothetical protein
LATVSFENVPIIAVVEVSSSLASNWTFSVFFALEIAIVLLQQGSVVSNQWSVPQNPLILVPVSLLRASTGALCFEFCCPNRQAGHEAKPANEQTDR